MKNIVIYGPTAVGKSSLAVMLAKKLNAEIISCDSMQVYKDLNIGSAKITQEEMDGVTHHMLDVKNCDDTYSVYEYVSDCKQCIENIKKKGKNVIIVGGTGLYIKALTENYNYGGANNKQREQFSLLSNEELISKLNKLGQTVKQDDINNRPRLIRYLEIANNGESKQHKYNDDYLIFGLTLDRQILYDRINKRVDKMIEDGLINETKLLYEKYGEENQCFKAIGYKELLPYLRQEQSFDYCIQLIKQHSRNYAKRQITFMNQFKNIIKIDVQSFEKAFDEILKHIR